MNLETAWDVAAHVPDPEIPVLNIAELGILRDVSTDDSGGVTVTITPTYSGCPAMREIERLITSKLAEAGFPDVTMVTQLSPAWTTDWMSEQAKDKLENFGIAPPPPTTSTNVTRCPQCHSTQTQTISPFGSTACKALLVCSNCSEPFDLFKAL